MNHTTDKYMNKGSKSRLNFYQKPALQQEYLSHHHVLPCLVTLWRSAILHHQPCPGYVPSELGFFISEGGCELLHRIKWQTQSRQNHLQWYGHWPRVDESSCGLWVLEVLHLEHGCPETLQGLCSCCSGSGLEDGAPPFTTMHSEQRWSMNKTHSTLGGVLLISLRRTSKALLVKALSLAVRNSSLPSQP